MPNALRLILGAPLWLRFAALLAPLAAATGCLVWQSLSAAPAAKARAETLRGLAARARLSAGAGRLLVAAQRERGAEAGPARDAAWAESDTAATALRAASEDAHRAAGQAGPARAAAARAVALLDALPALRIAAVEKPDAYRQALLDLESPLAQAAVEPAGGADGPAALAELQADAETAAGAATRAGVAFGALGMLALAVGAGFAWASVKQASEVARLARGLADGRAEAAAQVLGRDELGRAAEALNDLAGAGGAAAQRAELAQELAPVAAELAGHSASVRAFADQQRAAAADQESVVADSAAALGLFARAADDTFGQAQEFGAQARRAVEIAGTGRQAVRDALADLDRVRGQVDAAARAVSALSEQAQEVGDIVATLNDVAEQTNLMALNAALEASRAGEHGQGFAVVAGEIKELAHQSQRATAQVRQLLGEIQNATNTAALASEQGSKDAAQAAKVALRAGEAIDGLDAALVRAAEASAGIASAAAEQSAGMGTVSQAIARLEEATHDRAEALGVLARAADSLEALGGRLTGFAEPPEPGPRRPRPLSAVERLAALRLATRK